MAQVEVTNGATTVEKPVTFTAYKPVLFVEAQKVGDAVAFYKSAFGAVESGHSLYPKRKLDQELPHVLSAEIELAGVTIIVSDVSTDSDSTEKKEGTTNATTRLETEDVEAAVSKSVAAGAVKVGEVSEVESEGGRVQGKVTDPFGFTWIIVSPAKKSEKAETDENKEV